MRSDCTPKKSAAEQHPFCTDKARFVQPTRPRDERPVRGGGGPLGFLQWG
jgi:hypothetical protein